MSMGSKASEDQEGSLLPIYFSIFVTVLGFSLVAPIFPLYVVDLGASYTLLGFIISIYGAVQLITQIPMGRLSDRKGRKPLMLFGLMTFAIMPPLYIYATNAYSLIPIRIIGGAGASAVWPIAMAMIIDKASREKRGSYMGLYNAAFYSALAIGPLIGGYIYDLYGLAAPFYLWAALGIISVFIVLTMVSEPRQRQKLSKTNQTTEKADLILPGYIPTFLACCGVVMWAGIVGGFNITMLPSYASRLGLSTTEIGLLYLDCAGITALSNIYFGRIADRARRKVLIAAGCFGGMLSFLLLLQASTLSQVLMLLAAIGLALGIGIPAASAMIADITCIPRRGEIFGIFNTARMSGVVIGPLVAGLTADIYGLNGAILAFTGLAAAIAAGTLLIREPKTKAS